ncbi:MAG TPA: kelch repeat-containing protein [bacterium]
MKASVRTALILAGLALSFVPAHAQQQTQQPSDAEDVGQGPQILTSDLARRQSVEQETLTASFLFVDEQPIVDIRINGEPQKFTQDTSVIILKQFDNKKEQQVIEVAATNVAGKTRQKSFLVLNPTAVRRFGETIPKYYRIEDRWDTKWVPLAVARAGAAGSSIGSVMYLFGGQSTFRYDYDVNQVLSKDPSVYVNSAERFDPTQATAVPGTKGDTPGKTELLSDVPKTTSPVSSASVAQALYVFESRSKGYVYDPKDNVWRSFDTPFKLNRVGPAITIKDKIYIFGGLFAVQTANQPAKVTPSLQVWEYNPAAGSFAIRKALPTARGGSVACSVKGIIYVFGGYDGDNYLDNTEAYDPANDSWKKLPRMPTARAFAGCVVVNDLIYVIGGRGGGLFGEKSLGTMEMFDPATGIWRGRRSVPTARAEPVTIAVEGVIYVMGGTDGSKALNVVEAYR